MRQIVLDLVEERLEFEGAAPRRDDPGFQAREVQQRVEHVRRRDVRGLGVLEDPPLRRGEIRLAQRLEEQALGVDRLAQIVAGRRQELRLGGVGVLGVAAGPVRRGALRAQLLDEGRVLEAELDGFPHAAAGEHDLTVLPDHEEDRADRQGPVGRAAERPEGSGGQDGDGDDEGEIEVPPRRQERDAVAAGRAQQRHGQDAHRRDLQRERDPDQGPEDRALDDLAREDDALHPAGAIGLADRLAHAARVGGRPEPLDEERAVPAEQDGVGHQLPQHGEHERRDEETDGDRLRDAVENEAQLLGRDPVLLRRAHRIRPSC